MVSMFDRKWRDRVASTELSSGFPETDTAVLPPEDQSPGVYFISSFVGSKRKFALIKSFGKIDRLSGVWCGWALAGSPLPKGEGDRSCMIICR